MTILITFHNLGHSCWVDFMQPKHLRYISQPLSMSHVAFGPEITFPVIANYHLLQLVYIHTSMLVSCDWASPMEFSYLVTMVLLTSLGVCGETEYTECTAMSFLDPATQPGVTR